MLAKTIRVFGKVWLFGACFVFLLGYGATWYQSGFGALQELLSPYNFSNLIAVAIALAPAYFFDKLAGEIEAKERRKAFRSVLGLFLSMGLLVLIVMLMSMKNNTNKEGDGDNRTREYQAISIRVKGKSATMYQHKNYFVTVTSGPVGSDGIPEFIQVGDVVTVKDSTIHAQYIFVTEVLEDMKYGNEILSRKGEVHCIIVQSRENLPYVDEHESRDRLWINVKDCEPLKKMDQ